MSIVISPRPVFPLLVPVNSVTRLEYKDIYTVSAWMSLLGNVPVAEYYIIQRTLAPLVRREPVPAPAPIPV